MNKYKFFAFCISALLLNSCSIQDKYKEKKLKPFVGKNESELVMEYGNPTLTYSSGDAKFLYWYNLEKNFIFHSCRTWFKIDKEGKVLDYKFSGMDCGLF